MKIGVLLTDLSPEIGGGYTLQQDIYQSLAELVDESHHTFLVFSNPVFAKSGLAASNRLQVVAYPAPDLIERAFIRANRELETFRVLWNRPSRLDREARARGVEFLCFFDLRSPIRVDVPYMTIVLDLQHRLQPWFPEVSANGIWDRREAYHSWFLRRASIVVTWADVGCKEIERFYQIPAERIKRLPLPTPRFALRTSTSEGKQVLDKYGIPSGYLFYPAQFWAHKNHANLLLAVRKLRDESKLEYPVVFVGSDKGNQMYIQQLARSLGLSEQVHFLGFVPQEDLVWLYRNAFALTCITFFGPDNLPPLEAFALGCPVIVSNVSGTEEQFGDAALFVDPKSPEHIAWAIKSLHDDLGLRSRLVQKGKERAAKWTGRDFVRGLFAILDEFESIRRCWE